MYLQIKNNKHKLILDNTTIKHITWLQNLPANIVCIATNQMSEPVREEDGSDESIYQLVHSSVVKDTHA